MAVFDISRAFADQHVWMPIFFQDLEDFDTGPGFICSDISGSPQAAVHINQRRLPDFALLIVRICFFAPDIVPQRIQLPALDFKSTASICSA